MDFVLDSATLVSSGRDQSNRGSTVFAVTTVTLVLATVFVASRLTCRVWIVRRVTWDDHIMWLAWLIAFMMSFTINLASMRGLGQHDIDIPPNHRNVLRHCEYIFSVLYNPALMATKTSILVFYLRMAKNTQVVLRYASWALLVIVNLAGAVLTLMNIFQCNPIAGAWSPNINKAPKCIPLLTEFICSAPVNIVTDLAILAVPIPVLTGMRLPTRQKTILVLTFLVGTFVSVVDVIRIYYLQYAITAVSTGSSTNPESNFGGSPDFAWRASPSLMWSAVEVNVGIICACVPTLKPLVLKLLPAMLYDPNRTRTSASQENTTGKSDSTPPPQPVPPPQARISGEDADLMAAPDGSLSMMDFLTSPESIGGKPRPQTARTTHTVQSGAVMTNSSMRSSRSRGVYFGFVNMQKPKSMLKTNASESLKYCSMVCILFLLWGVSYGLLNTLNNVIAGVDKMTEAETLGLSAIYWGGGYFFGPLLVGEWILRRDEHNRTNHRRRRTEGEHIGGFKVTFIVGLCIYGVGTIIFWPSVVTGSFGGFMLSNFVVGFGLSVLEVAANTFLILCGPAAYGEFRLLVAQGVQGVGSVLSGLLAQKVFFKNISGPDADNSLALINVQWTYLAITLLCVILGLFFYYMPLPEVSDDELHVLAQSLPVDGEKKVFGGVQLRTMSIVLAVLAQYLYVGAQESNSIFFSNLLTSIIPGEASAGSKAADAPGEAKPSGLKISIPDYLLIGHTAFFVSRFLVAYLVHLGVKYPRLPKPRTYLTISIVLCFLFSLLPVVLHPSNPDLLVIPVMLFFFAEGPMWPLIFAIGLRGQGRRTKRAAAFITMGGSGATFFPFVMYGIIKQGGTVQIAYIMIIALQASMMAYPIFLEFVKDARGLVDPRPLPATLREDEELTFSNGVVATQNGVAASNEKKSRRSSLGAAARQLFPKATWKGRRPSSTIPEVEHHEQS